MGYSPCPNDTFLFYALAQGLIDLPGLQLPPLLADVETLNNLARNGRLAISKVSCHALGHLRRDYALLRSGAALGRGCGPPLVARHDLSQAALADATIAIPGGLTTAGLLLRMWLPQCGRLLAMPFDRIMAAVRGGQADAGLLIHEGRFTCEQQGLVKIIDFGCWWQELTGLPLPLGAIVAKRGLGGPRITCIENAVAASVAFARDNPHRPLPYIRRHAQEKTDEAIQRHIALYVNDFTFDLGDEGLAAIDELLGRASAAGLIPQQKEGLRAD
ncbi:MAG: 1,4-dihydroxy-6-naphthoate synthase [Syntrophotaleaceae bacterium]